MNALILVDIQNDFLPGGSLAVPQGDEVVEVANQLMDSHELIVATQDHHPRDHGSFASNQRGHRVGEVIQLDGLDQILWPDHCVLGTSGAQFAPGLQMERVERIFEKGIHQNVDSYSGFFDNGQRHATGLEDFLREKGVERVTVVGLATDYCVKFTALDAAELGFETTVRLAGCRGVELQPGDVENAVEEMRQAGIEVV